MPEIKVECDCGQRYKFEVEPVNGRMPFQINCPSCGLDGTEKANAVLRQSAVPPAPLAPVAIAAAPVAAPLTAAPPPVPAGPPRLRINPTASHAAAPAAVAETASAPAPAPRRFMPAPAVRSEPKSEDQPRMLLGVIGALIGGFIGMMAWYWLVKVTHLKIGWVAWGVGAFTGFGARALARAASPILGAVSGFSALIAITGGLYIVSADIVSTELGGFDVGKLVSGMAESIGGADYDEKAKHSQEALKAKTDDEIKAVYVKVNLEQPSPEELSEFKTNELVVMQDIANGKLTRQQYINKLKAEATGAISDVGAEARWDLFKKNMDVYMIIFLLLGVTSAFKVANG